MENCYNDNPPQKKLKIENDSKIEIDLSEEKSIKDPDPLPNKYFFTNCGDGCIRQFDIKRNLLLNHYRSIHENKIFSIATTNDGKYLFTSCWDGVVKQFNIQNHKLVWDYGRIHRDRIYSIATTADSKYL